MTEEVKSCPFCGGKAEISEGAIYCPVCEISFANERETGAEAIKEVEELWNARPIENELEAEKARLREALKKIIDRAEKEESKASNTTYCFAYDIEDIARDALKGGKK